MLVAVVAAHSRSELSSCRVHSPRKSGQLVSAYPAAVFYVTGHVQCRESWHLPLRGQCPSKPRASKYCRRVEGQCCGAVTQLWMLTALAHGRRRCEQAGHRMSRQGTETSGGWGEKIWLCMQRVHISSTARCVGVLAASGGEMLKVVG